MWPISIFNYYRNNTKKFLSVLIPVALSIFLVYILEGLISSAFTPGYNSGIEPKKYFSTVRPNGRLLDQSIIDTLKGANQVDRVIPCVFDGTSFQTNIGVSYNTMIMSLRDQDLKELMSTLGLRLVDGRLPIPGSYEIVLNEQLAKNKRIRIGDYIGRWISKSEGLPSAYKVVGLIDGKAILSFASIDTYINSLNMNFDYTYGAVILPRQGQINAVNSYLNSMPPSDISISTLTTESDYYNTYLSRINTLVSIVNVLLIVIVAFCTGFLYYIYFTQRRSELGLLWSLGFSRQQVINKAFVEISSANSIGYVLGLAISILSGAVLNYIYLNPLGQPLHVITSGIVIKTLCVPLFVTLFSIIPVWRMLKSLDPISVIEGVI